MVLHILVSWLIDLDSYINTKESIKESGVVALTLKFLSSVCIFSTHF